MNAPVDLTGGRPYLNQDNNDGDTLYGEVGICTRTLGLMYPEAYMSSKGRDTNYHVPRENGGNNVFILHLIQLLDLDLTDETKF